VKLTPWMLCRKLGGTPEFCGLRDCRRMIESVCRGGDHNRRELPGRKRPNELAGWCGERAVCRARGPVRVRYCKAAALIRRGVRGG